MDMEFGTDGSAKDYICIRELEWLNEMLHIFIGGGASNGVYDILIVDVDFGHDVELVEG